MHIMLEFNVTKNEELAKILSHRAVELNSLTYNKPILTCEFELCDNQELHAALEPHWKFITEHELSHDE